MAIDKKVPFLVGYQRRVDRNFRELARQVRLCHPLQLESSTQRLHSRGFSRCVCVCMCSFCGPDQK